MKSFLEFIKALLSLLQRFGRMRALLCGVLSAIFLIFSFPPFAEGGWWWLSLLIPLPLMALAADPVIRPSRAAFFAGLGTLPAWLWTHHWMWGVSEFGTPFLMIYLMVFPALFVWAGHRIISRFGRPWFLLPVVWIGVEFLRGHAAFTGYAWYLSVQPLIESPGQILAGPAAYGGASGMYFVGLLAATLGYQILRILYLDRVVARGFIVVGLGSLWIGIGLSALGLGARGGVEPESSTRETRSIVVGVVQPNVPQDNRMDWTDRQRYLDWTILRELTVGSARDPEQIPDVIVWPEGFVPGWTFDPISLEHERSNALTWSMVPRYAGDAVGLTGVPERMPATRVVDELLVMQRILNIPMVVGSVAFENLQIERDDNDWVMYTNDGMYNSAFVVSDGKISDSWYNKMHLTPFGEVMPVISRWAWLEQKLLGLGATGMEFVLSAGDQPVVLEVPFNDGQSIKIGTPICFEATVPGVCRSLVFDGATRKADLLVNLTNDGWFGGSETARRSHLLIARWRCVELSTPMVRSANTGVSSVIDHRGGIVKDRLDRVDPDDPASGYLNARVELGSGGTNLLIDWFGRLFGWGVLGFCMIATIMTFLQKRSEPTPVTDE
ncbi:MAG: apolipoprotein N-acyltransferase [Phycisphaerales bacterium]